MAATSDVGTSELNVAELQSDAGIQESDVGGRHSNEGDNDSQEGGNGLDVGSSATDAPGGLSENRLDTDGNPADAVGSHSDTVGSHSDTVETGSDVSGRSDDFIRADEFERSDDAYGRPSAADEFFADRRESEEFELEYDEEEEDEEGSWVERRGPTAQWLLETPQEDRIGPSHYRRILSATCTDLEPLGRSRVVRIHIEGESFMLHQVGAYGGLRF